MQFSLVDIRRRSSAFVVSCVLEEFLESLDKGRPGAEEEACSVALDGEQILPSIGGAHRNFILIVDNLLAMKG